MLGKTVSELLTMPVWELKLWIAYLNKVPTTEERLEWCLAQLSALFANANRDPTKSSPRKLKDMFLFEDPWELQDKPAVNDSRYSEVDRSIMAALMEN